MPPSPQAKATVRKLGQSTIVRIPWLKPFEDRAAKYGITNRYTEFEADAGSTVYEDIANKLVSVAGPNGQVWIWSNLATMRIWPRDQTWRMEWRDLDENVDDVVFSIEKSDDEDEIIAATGYDIYSEHFEGQEGRFPEFVALARNAAINPVPFPLKSGIYGSSGTAVRFKIDFGENGGTPALSVFDDSLPPVLDFPYRTVVAVKAPVQAGDETVPPGEYTTQVSGYRTDTGQVTNIKIRGPKGSHYISGEALIGFLAGGQMEILEVIEDQMPSF